MSVTHDFTHAPVARGLRRLTGVIGRWDRCLFIPRCASVHTWFMSDAIDVVFLDRLHVVVSIRGSVRPWRIAFGPRGTRSVLELPARRASEVGVAVGDVINLPA